MFRIGIIGAGWIADKMAEAIAPFKDMCVYAIASRSIEKAQQFAQERNIEKAYGSYEELVADPKVDLVYIATPHSHHFQHSMLALEHGKPVLVEKAFTANAQEAEILIRTAREKGIFITEAIWTRYMPLSHKVKELMESGIIGEPRDGVQGKDRETGTLRRCLARPRRLCLELREDVLRYGHSQDSEQRSSWPDRNGHA